MENQDKVLVERLDNDVRDLCEWATAHAREIALMSEGAGDKLIE